MSNSKWRSFKKARAFVRKLGLQSNQEWRAYVRGDIKKLGKKPDDIPSNPNFVYKDDGWNGYGDWLGNGNVSTRNRQYRSYSRARAFIRRLGLNNENEWRMYVKGQIKGLPKKPDDIPASPHMSYKDKGWQDYGDWLGTGNISYHLREWRNFNKARSYVRRLKLKNSNEWRQYCRGQLKRAKKPDDIPATPYKVYEKNGWKGMQDWLGIKNSNSGKSQNN